MKRGGTISLLTVIVQSCGPSLEDQIERLGAGGEEAEQAKQELLLDKDTAVPVLLEALGDPELVAGRAELAEVLVGMMVRVDDETLSSRLKAHLVNDPDPKTRARIAREVGITQRRDFADAYLEAADDADGQVRGEALTALSFLRHHLSEEQLAIASQKARLHQDDENRDAQFSARIIVAEHVDSWLREAGKEALKGQLTTAESLYHEALAYDPRSMKANLKLGLHYFENGDRARGLQVLRDSGWLVDVPIFDTAPVLDGRLDDEIWSRAARIGPFFTWSGRTNAGMHSKVHTELYAGYTDEALFIAARCEDAHPESLKVVSSERDHAEPYFEDIIELFFDVTLDRKSAFRFSLNSTGTIVDGLHEVSRWRYPDFSIDWESEADAFVSDDYWSLEFKLVLGQPDVPMPAPGTIWGVDVSRGYRGGAEWSQATPNFPDMEAIEAFGWFLFE